MKEGELFQKVVDLIRKSNLPEADRNFWYQEIKKVPKEYLFLFLGFLETFPEKLAWFTNLHKRKMEAFAKGDKATWQALLQEEERTINEVTKEEEK